MTLLLLWAGLVFGVSFLATPIKFAAPNLTMPVALEVGVATFSLFNRVEWVMCALVVVAAFLKKPCAQQIAVACTLAFLLLLQTFWLLPILHARAAIVISGGAQQPSFHHEVYIITELLKLCVIAIGVWVTRRSVQ